MDITSSIANVPAKDTLRGPCATASSDSHPAARKMEGFVWTRLESQITLKAASPSNWELTPGKRGRSVNAVSDSSRPILGRLLKVPEMGDMHIS